MGLNYTAYTDAPARIRHLRYYRYSLNADVSTDSAKQDAFSYLWLEMQLGRPLLAQDSTPEKQLHARSQNKQTRARVYMSHI